jgi:hypothetical protein
MKPVVLMLMAGIVFGGALASAGAQGRGQNAQKGAAASPVATVSGGVHITFSTDEARLIRAHYAPRYRNLPPGLQKKMARGKALPPGWQKKMEPFPVEFERRLARLPDGYRRGVIDGHAVIYLPGTSVVVDVAALF